MGRGGSASEVEANLTLVAARKGDVRGTALEAVLPVNLSPRQETSLLALALLMREMPEAPGFESYDICEAGYRVISTAAEPKADHLFVPPSPGAGHASDNGLGAALSLNNAGAIAASLVKKGLVAKTTSVRKGVSGEVSDDEHGWRLTTAGLQLAGATSYVVAIGG